MTDNELKKLNRMELLEILFSLRRELDSARRENEALRQSIDGKRRETDEELLRLARLSADRLGKLCEAQGISVGETERHCDDE